MKFQCPQCNEQDRLFYVEPCDAGVNLFPLSELGFTADGTPTLTLDPVDTRDVRLQEPAVDCHNCGVWHHIYRGDNLFSLLERMGYINQ